MTQDSRAPSRLTLPPDLSRLPEVRAWAWEAGIAASLPDARIFDLQVTVSEAAANAIEHAASAVELTAWILADRLVIEVINDGVFQPGLYKDHEGRRRGLGLPLIVSLADQVHVSRLPSSKTQISLTFFLHTRRDGTRELPAPGSDAAAPTMGAVSEGEDRYKNLVDLSPDAILVDVDGKHVFANAAAARLFGARSPSDVIGRSLIDSVCPEDREFVAQQMGQVIGGHVKPPSEIQMLRLDGSPISAEVSASRVQFGGNLANQVVIRDISQRKRAEEEVRELTQRLSYHIEHSPLAVIEWGPDMRLIRWSEQAERAFGWRADEVLGKRIEDFRWVYEDDAVRVDEVSTELQDGSNPRRFSLNRNYRKDGSVVWCEWYNSSLLDQTGQLRSILSLVLDVTEQRRAQERLRENEEELRAFFDSPGFMRGIVDVVDDSTVLHVRDNQATAAFVGLTPGALSNKTSADLGEPPEVIRSWVEHYRESQRTGQPVTFEYREPRGNGHVWLATTVSYLRTEPSGRPRFAYVVADITERKCAEEALLESDERFRLLVEQAADGIFLADAQGRYTDANMSGLEMLGYTLEELRELTVADVIVPEEVPRMPAQMESLAGKVVVKNEWQFRRKNGSTFTGEVVGRQLPDGRLLGILRDVTGRKQAEAALLESEEQFRVMFERHGAAMLLIEPDSGQITDANEAAVRFYGYSLDQLRAMRIDQINQLPPEEVAAERRKAVREDKSLFVFPHRLAGGEVRFVEVYSSKVMVRDRPMLFSVIHDISDRKQAEEALERTRDRLAEAQRIAHLGSFEYAAATQTTVWSEEEYRIYGLDPAGPSPAYDVMLADCIHPDDAALLDSTFTKAMETSSIYELEHRVVRPDGSVRWVYDRAHPYFDEQGNLLRYVGATLDITERKHAEERYRTLAEENERLYRQQLDIAENLQAAFLHIPAELGPVRLGHLYRSATEAARVGGDFYDVFQVKEGKIALLIGDVAGHGIEAARTATLVKDVVHAFIHQTQRTHQVLKRTNKLLIEKGLPGYVTLFLGILDTQTGELRYSSAGHPDMLVRRASAEIETLRAGSSPLGIYPDAVWKPRGAELQADDLLVLFTDGVIEARHNGEMFGEKRLEALVKSKRIAAEQLPHVILDRVLAFSEGMLQDDVAILTLRLRNKGTSDQSKK